MINQMFIISRGTKGSWCLSGFWWLDCGLLCWTNVAERRAAKVGGEEPCAETLLQRAKGSCRKSKCARWPDFAGSVRLIVKMRHTYLPLKQRQPKRAPGTPMLMLSGALTSSSHCTGAAPCDSHGAALPLGVHCPAFSRRSTFGRCSGKKKPNASYLFTFNSELQWTKRISWT